MWQYYLLTANLIDEQCRGVWANCINLVPLKLPLLCWHNLLTAAIETLYGTWLLPRFISIRIKILLQTLKNLRCKCTRVWQVFTCLKESLSTVSYLFSINHTQGIYPIGVTGGDPNRRVCVVGMSRMHNLSEGRDGVVKTEKGRWESRSRTRTKTRRINRFNRTCKWWSRLAWISEHKKKQTHLSLKTKPFPEPLRGQMVMRIIDEGSACARSQSAQIVKYDSRSLRFPPCLSSGSASPSSLWKSPPTDTSSDPNADPKIWPRASVLNGTLNLSPWVGACVCLQACQSVNAHIVLSVCTCV